MKLADLYKIYEDLRYAQKVEKELSDTRTRDELDKAQKACDVVFMQLGSVLFPDIEYRNNDITQPLDTPGKRLANTASKTVKLKRDCDLW